MGYFFDPDELHQISRDALDAGDTEAIIDTVVRELKGRYPAQIRDDVPWMFNNAGGAMGQMKLLHCSLSEYILVFGTPIGTEGHSGRYRTEVYDFMLAGEMWCYHAGEVERAIYRPGDAAFLGADRAKGYRVPDHAWMLEYSRGPIPMMLPFGLSDSMVSTLDTRTIGQTIWHYGRMTVGNLLRGKI
ncbi:MAG: hypothetical protein KC420_03275 [Myxococcales bacterium]|nr:hypothetical protein [Myxococcales bacterium]MCB9566663.1 hypothetical protein [Myxococcales bacterium]MCB9704394.1 hypothetical protein [Myxococcales bacterium]